MSLICNDGCNDCDLHYTYSHAGVLSIHAGERSLTRNFDLVFIDNVRKYARNRKYDLWTFFNSGQSIIPDLRVTRHLTSRPRRFE